MLHHVATILGIINVRIRTFIIMFTVVMAVISTIPYVVFVSDYYYIVDILKIP